VLNANFKRSTVRQDQFILQNKAFVNFDWVQLPFQSRGFPIKYVNNIAIFDDTLHELTQMVFPETQRANDVAVQENPNFRLLIWNLHGNSTA
jgi:hypothetical protein